MEIPVLATEQYPRGLGPTVPELGLAKYELKAHPKTSFSMVLPELMKELREKQQETKSVILCGIETQACIHHTTLDLPDLGIEVHIAVDCCSSRSMVDRRVRLESSLPPVSAASCPWPRTLLIQSSVVCRN